MRRRFVVLAHSSVVILFLIGLVARLQGLTTTSGLFRDDAWVIAPVRAPGAIATRLTWTFPGFAYLERSIAAISPTSTLLAQALPFLAGIAALPVLWWMIRQVIDQPRHALAIATIVALSPIALTYSTRAKPYAVELLLGAVLLVMAEHTRQRPTTRNLVQFIASSIVATFISFAVLPVLVGGWVAVGWSTPKGRGDQTRVLSAMAAAGGGAGLIVLALFHGTPPSLHAFWEPFYVSYDSPQAFLRSLEHIFGGIPHGLFGTALLQANHPLASLVSLMVIVLLIGLARRFARSGGEVALAPLATVGAAFALAALRIVPLGTGRTDEVLYPAIALIIAGGLATPVALRRGCVTGVAGGAVGLWSLIIVILSFTTNAPQYPTMAWNAVVAPIAAARVMPTPSKDTAPAPETTAFVIDAPLRYDWAIDPGGLAAPEFHITNATEPGYTVNVSTGTEGLFVAPADPGDATYLPQRWATQLTAASAGPWQRSAIVFFGITEQVVNPTTGPLGSGARVIHRSPLYTALLADGWVGERTFFKPGVFAQVLVRSNGPR